MKDIPTIFFICLIWLCVWQLNHNPERRDYQLDIQEHGTYVYDGNRYIGFLPYDEAQRLDSLLVSDNL